MFAVDVLSGHRCGGRREVLALITEESVVRAILECLGLPAGVPVIHTSRSRSGWTVLETTLPTFDVAASDSLRLVQRTLEALEDTEMVIEIE